MFDMIVQPVFLLWLPHTCVPQVRVMPKCWFVLLRMWLRVDGVMVRLREARFFCRCVTKQLHSTGLGAAAMVDGCTLWCSVSSTARLLIADALSQPPHCCCP